MLKNYTYAFIFKVMRHCTTNSFYFTKKYVYAVTSYQFDTEEDYAVVTRLRYGSDEWEDVFDTRFADLNKLWQYM